MAESGSILDKIIEQQHLEEEAQFNPAEIIGELLKGISPKEHEIISRRFGLDGGVRKTLEEIGASHQITRERIRQIQVAAVKKIKSLEQSRTALRQVEHTVTHALEAAGGLMEEVALLDTLLAHTEKTEQNRSALLFMISELLEDRVERIRQSEHVLPGWKLRVLSMDLVHRVLDVLHGIVHKHEKLLPTPHILERFKQHEFFAANKHHLLPAGAKLGGAGEADLDRVILSYLAISAKINQNILGEWGLTSWNTVSPRRMGDKIYLILRKVGKPMHFTEIADAINAANFDHKVAYPATIHNELILDDRYVLVGRGIYALREWGYEPGTVSEVIQGILREAGEPMTRDEIVAAVGKRRIVRHSTIYLALTDRSKFRRSGDQYELNAQAEPLAA